jgi:hypothetical protein
MRQEYSWGQVFITLTAADTGGFISFERYDSEQVEYSQYGTIGTGVFTEGSLNKKGKNHNNKQYDNSGKGHFSRPELKKSIIGVNISKKQLTRAGCHKKNPGKEKIAEKS